MLLFFSFLASLFRKSVCIKRRLLCRFLCQGSGKNICIRSKDLSGNTEASNSTASPHITFKLRKSRFSISASKLPTPGRWTSMPIKSVCGESCAIWANDSPMPKPISRTLGLELPNSVSRSLTIAWLSIPNLGQSVSRARFWFAVICPSRRTKLFI